MRRSQITALAVLLSTTVAAEAARRLPADVPLPPTRPPEIQAPKAEPSTPVPKLAPAAPAAPAATSERPPESGDASCVARLQALGYELHAVSPAPADRAACRISDPVSLRSVADGRTHVNIDGELVLDCRTAEAFGSWLTNITAPLFEQALGSPLRAVRQVGGYECRNRNRRPDGKISAHAQGLAVDVGAFELANGTTISVGNVDPKAREAVAALRKAACGWFLTVLGPGTDPDHATHFHLDLLQHGSSDRYKICQ